MSTHRTLSADNSAQHRQKISQTLAILCISLSLLACTAADPPQPGGLTAAERRQLARRERAGDFSVLSVDSPADAPPLHHASRPVDPAADLAALIADLQRTTRQQHGAGLAAVQIGIPLRVVVLRQGHSDDFQTFLNPALVRASADTLASWENCLSVPWGYRYTERASRIEISHQNPAGETLRQTLIGEDAVVMQQELDHLDGRLLSDDQSPNGFVPPQAMYTFTRDINRQCQTLPRQACAALMRERWQAWGRGH